MWLHGFSHIIACTFVQYSISLHLSFKIQFYNIIIDFIKNWLVLKTAYVLSNSVVVHLVLLLNNICLTLNKRWPTKKGFTVVPFLNLIKQTLVNIFRKLFKFINFHVNQFFFLNSNGLNQYNKFILKWLIMCSTLMITYLNNL